MRKLRNLWSSHKKYCTTLPPYRSYTPLSGYPNSRSSYDLDYTYYTSTPNTYRNRFRRLDDELNSARDDIGILTSNFSDLSIDKIVDSDDDQLKRQVEMLGRSLRTNVTPAPSNYQAPSPHTTTTNRTAPHTTSDTRRNNTGDDSTGHATLQQQPAQQPDRLVSDNDQTTRVNEDSQHIIKEDAQNAQPNAQEEINIHQSINPVITHQTNEEIENTNEQIDQPEEVHEQPENQNFTDENYEQYDQNYEQTQANTEYHQEEYEEKLNQNEQNLDQTYVEPHYENYEQYPQQYETNAQYDNQYESYPAGSNYQGENYEDQQYAQEYPTEYEEVNPQEATIDSNLVQEEVPENISKQPEFTSQEQDDSESKSSPTRTEVNKS
ncbi:hypothetical protein RR48_07112 [Papilio machaon]|uniref:Uncharacterized protein n=1 Tax=Papilio machaon TaxID=76193 RepID=A0A194RJL0_PAPMA|nr:hypothetical protein RR48_07112 [Papilio machaon]